MSHWGNVLKEARGRAGLTQEELAEKVPISVSYIRKMETGLLGPPSRKKAEMLADALNITDVEKRNAFFRAAEVGNDEDMQGFKLVKVEEDEVEQGEQQAIPTPITSLALPPEDDDFTFGSPLKTTYRRSPEKRGDGEAEQAISSPTDETAQLRQLLAQVDALRTTIEVLIAAKEQQHGRTERP